MLAYISSASICISRLKSIYPHYTYELASIYILIISVIFASIIGAIRLRGKIELLWGLGFGVWGLIMAQYTSYSGILLAGVKIGPLIGYCLWTMYRMERCKALTKAKIAASDRQEDLEAELRLSKYSYYEKWCAAWLLITIPIWLATTFYFAFFYEAIPREQRGHALIGSLIAVVAVVLPFYLIITICNYLFKKVHDVVIWISVGVTMSIGIVPSLLGLGWKYAAFVGIPWGIVAFYTEKMEQERWKVRKGNKDL